jgi:septum formation protein
MEDEGISAKRSGPRRRREAATGSRAALVLASASPQRRTLLERLGVAFTVMPQGVEEIGDGDPREVVLENARRKARAACDAGADGVVLGCDTLVALGGKIYGKPADEHAARAALRALGGATHEVFGGLVLLVGGELERSAVARTEVTLRDLSQELIDWYLAYGEWRGRAGGYAIQGAGAALVRDVRGDYENVVGLPLAALLDMYPELLLD